MATKTPLVSIVTPVYNNAAYIGECIESVLAQSYQNWDYSVIDNCSTDGSGEIARRYAGMDSRIRVIENVQFLRVVANHNHALRQISPESKYCKMVFADDWMFPRCIEEMVSVAEESPRIGMVGAYSLESGVNETSGKSFVAWTGLPYPSRRTEGREICRRTFLEGISVFGTANSVLYRSDLVRQRPEFFNEGNFHADFEAAFSLLKGSDFGFVHQVLTFTRLRDESLITMAVDMQMDLGCKLQTLASHGRDFLNDKEYKQCVERLLAKYYNFLAVSLMRGRREERFWSFHNQKLEETVGFSRTRLAKAILARVCRSVLSPYETVSKLRGIAHSRSKPVGSDAQTLGARATDKVNASVRA
jgi:glycosyltransferase involved in cell wall biosynthesis